MLAMNKTALTRVLTFAIVGFAATAALAGPTPQFWDICFDFPENRNPLSTNANATDPGPLSNGILSVVLGLAGTENFGPNPVCPPPYADKLTHDIAGSISFMTFNGSALS